MSPPTTSSAGRPLSALSVPRSHSSLSVNRPSSSASIRPLSRLSTRSGYARQSRSRLIPYAQTLVRQITGLDDDDAESSVSSKFRESVDYVVKNLETTTLNKGAASVDMSEIDRQIHGLSLKARLNFQDRLGEALETCYHDLKLSMEKEHDLDQKISTSHLPDHLQLLNNMRLLIYTIVPIHHLNATDQNLVISLLSTEKAIHATFQQTFEVLLEIVKAVFPDSSEPSSSRTRTRSAAAISADLLDRLFASVQTHLERQEHVTASALLRVFVHSAEPIWGMMGKWLRDGMGLGVVIGSGDTSGVWELDEEFFIESSGLGMGMMGLGLLDPEYWKDGYALREGVAILEGNREQAVETKRKTIPLFLEHVAEPVLRAGKAVGLLRALGVPLTSIDAGSNWKTFRQLLDSSFEAEAGITCAEQQGGLFSVSTDSLSRMIYEHLLPQCEAAGEVLARVLVEDCALWKHLSSIEDLFLMRRGDAMSHFTDVLFTKMDLQQAWSDFHFLNTAFSDVVEASVNVGAKKWIQTPLVRLSYRGGNKDRSIVRTIKALDGLAVEYAVPFPLTYVFQPAALQVYGEVFVLLLQIRRAKSVLERILVRGDSRGEKLRSELKGFYAIRSRLSCTFLNFLTTYVVHTQVLKFHDELRETRSLDEMVKLHDEHLEKIRGRCLLKPNTSSLHRAILSILDMALHFADIFVAFAGTSTTTLDVSRMSISIRRHRSRRHRHQRRNIIGFSQSLLENSSDDDDEFAHGEAPEPSFSVNTSTSYLEEGFQERMDKMSTELDGLVRFLRRGIESLAGGTGEAASAYGVLAFALEDWDT
ncbi:hypothetical protein H0H93_013206 [Arthromyces matolae]|nr:hypothetical protein H0H93_013206 [Arthromyces matolae]